MFSEPGPIQRFCRRAGLWSIALAFAASGCGGPKIDSPAVKSAIENLQRNQQQKAVDALAGEESARAAWIRAIALENLKQLDGARDQIKKAIELDSRNMSYRGLELRLQLYEAKMDAADEIIRLRDENRTSAALALFAFYAHSAKSVFERVMKKNEAAQTQMTEALSALNSAVALNADIPEFQRELLSLAVQAQLGDQVDLLSEKLLALAPDDPSILMDRISVLNSTGRFDDAAAAAEKLYLVEKRSERSAMLLSNMLARTAVSDAHRDRLAQLAKDHPESMSLMAQHAIYLAKAGEAKQAAAAFDKAIATRKDPAERRALIDSLITILLEVSQGDLAQSSLNKYRAEIGDPLLIKYFEGRVLYLKKEYVAALDKLTDVLRAQKDAVGTDRTLAANSLSWIQIMLSDKNASDTLKAAADALDKSLSGVDEEPAVAEIPEGK